jgi:tetratricopeptide (TPR) repeat protein
MMSMTSPTIGIACVFLSSAVLLSAASAVKLQESPDTKRILEIIEQSRGKVPDNWQAARALNAKGDKAYRRGRYSIAFTAYENAYPNAPDAYAYIMPGDSRWRDVVQYWTRDAGAARDGARCLLDNTHFAHDLTLDVAEHQAVGIALAERNHDARLLKSPLYRRARDQAACLQEMARRYESEPPTACVDLEQLSRCLGAPLIK